MQVDMGGVGGAYVGTVMPATAVLSSAFGSLCRTANQIEVFEVTAQGLTVRLISTSRG